MGSYEKFSNAIAKELVYDNEQVRLEDVVRVNECLTDFLLDIEKNADKIEAEVIKYINKYFNELINDMIKYNISIKTEALERNRKDMIASIEGKIRAHISKRVSMDNDECVKVLMLKPGEIKKTSMNILLRYSFYEAIKNFKIYVENVMDIQEKNIKEAIESRLVHLKDYIEYSDKIIKDLELEESNKNKTKEDTAKELNEKIIVYSEIIKILE